MERTRSSRCIVRQVRKISIGDGPSVYPTPHGQSYMDSPTQSPSRLMLLRMTPLAINLLLCACTPFSGESSKHSLTELRCEEATLDENNKCSNVTRTGADLEIIVNPTSQKVLIAITRDDGNWGIKSVILDNCAVVDASNWRCSQRYGQVEYEDAMFQGRYYRVPSSGSSPHICTSSVSGWRRWALLHNILSPRTAQEYD
jgi:hypothetical protein